jgi:hypothetical protein
VDVQVYVSLTSVLDSEGWTASRSGRFISGKTAHDIHWLDSPTLSGNRTTVAQLTAIQFSKSLQESNYTYFGKLCKFKTSHVADTDILDIHSLSCYFLM